MAKNDDVREGILGAIAHLTDKIQGGALGSSSIQEYGAAVRDLAEAYERIPKTRSSSSGRAMVG